MTITPKDEESRPASPLLPEVAELHRQIIDSVGEGVIAFDPELRYIAWNPFMELLMGIPADQVLGKKLQDLFPETVHNGRLDAISRALKGESLNLPDIQPMLRDGSMIWIQTQVSPLMDRRGAIVGVIATLRDITERKKSEEELRLARFTIERAALSIFWIESDGRIVDANEAACAMLGYSRDELLALKISDIDPGIKPGDWTEFRKYLRQGQPVTREGINRTKDGRLIPIEIASNFVHFGTRELNCAFVRDITGRKRAEEAVRSSEERYRLIVETAEEGIWIVDTENMTSFANRKMAEMLGTTVQEMLWQPILKYMDEADRPTALMYLERRRQGIREKFEFRFRRLNGTYLWTEIAANPVYDSEGKYLGSLRMVSDITDRKKTAELLFRSQEDLRALAARLEFAREEESTRIAREVHDELGQNLTAISMDLARLKKTLATSKDRELKVTALEKIDGIAQMLLNTVATVRHICSELRPNALEDVGLGAAIESYSLQFQARSNIRISLSLSGAPPTIEPARRSALFKIFQEILTNVARHAFATRLSIGLSEINGAVVLEVRDNGCGFDEALSRQSKTLGFLGMRERALAFGGTVEIQTALKRGTGVVVRIPLQRQKPIEPPKSAPTTFEI